MSKETIFGQALMRNYLVMLDCKTRRSLIAFLSNCYMKHKREYENARWKLEPVEYWGSFEVFDKIAKVEYLVKGSEYSHTKYLNKRKTEWTLEYRMSFAIYKVNPK